jgi:hypothetical protein
MAYDDRNLCETSRGRRKPRNPPLSPRMRDMLLHILRAEGQKCYVGPGHGFQTCVSLRNRGDVTGRIHGSAPVQVIRVELTAQGREKAEKLAAQEAMVKVPVQPEPQVDASWPFPCSSRPLKPPRPGPE